MNYSRRTYFACDKLYCGFDDIYMCVCVCVCDVDVVIYIAGAELFAV
jgi:hypothetical protein